MLIKKYSVYRVVFLFSGNSIFLSLVPDMTNNKTLLNDQFRAKFRFIDKLIVFNDFL